MDKYKIDDHKLMYHVSRVNDWLNGKIVYPIYMEICPSGACNHRCTYCAYDFAGYKNKFLETEVLKKKLSELGARGLKSVVYAGEGEPFLHPDMADIISHTAKSGIDVGIATNAVFFNEETAEKTLKDITWLKVSISGATEDTYRKIHRSKPGDISRVINNMKTASEIKRIKGYSCTLGMQLLLLPENCNEAVDLVKLARDIGMDYVVIKPYSQHPQSKTTKYNSVKYSEYEHLGDKIAQLNTNKFSAVFRIQTMREWDSGNSVRGYNRCLSTPFWSYIDMEGNVWGCAIYLGDEKFLYGNIYEESFQEIWQGKKRKKSLAWMENELDISKCRVNCRMNKINKYLWDLKNLPEHVNFI
ncbi:MAG: radical SAM protein [Candidatus Omnitrophota bacterium]